MSTIGEIRFGRDHVWVRMDDEVQATLGLTDYLQDKLGEIYSIRLPEEGEEFIKDEAFSVIEAKNGRRDLKLPEVSSSLSSQPSDMGSSLMISGTSAAS